jgi:hypothetical protein
LTAEPGADTLATGNVDGGKTMQNLWRIMVGVGCAGIFLAPPTSADIAPARQFGTTLAPWAASGIRMTREAVKIRLERRTAKFHATFWLKNDRDEPVSLDVGFPDAVRYGYWSSDPKTEPAGPMSKLRNFEVTVDGAPIKANPRYFRSKVSLRKSVGLLQSYRRREREIAQEKDPEEKARLRDALGRERESLGWWFSGGWLAWRMAFAAGDSHRVVVSYDLPYRPAYRRQILGFNAVEYILKSGALWRGPIGQVTVEIELADGLSHEHMAKLEPGGYQKTKTGFRWDLESLEPTEDVKIVLRDYANHRDAVRGYRERAEAARSEGEARKEAGLLCMAWEAAQKLEPRSMEIDLARRILAYERSVVAEKGTAFNVHPRVRIDIRAAYVPWEWRLVQSLDRNGRHAEAREAARAALPVLRRWMLDDEGRNRNWGRVEIATLRTANAYCERLISAK